MPNALVAALAPWCSSGLSRNLDQIPGPCGALLSVPADFCFQIVCRLDIVLLPLKPQGALREAGNELRQACFAPNTVFNRPSQDDAVHAKRKSVWEQRVDDVVPGPAELRVRF